MKTKGASNTEYVLILVLVSVLSVVAVKGYGITVKNLFKKTVSALDNKLAFDTKVNEEPLPAGKTSNNIVPTTIAKPDSNSEVTVSNNEEDNEKKEEEIDCRRVLANMTMEYGKKFKEYHRKRGALYKQAQTYWIEAVRNGWIKKRVHHGFFGGGSGYGWRVVDPRGRDALKKRAEALRKMSEITKEFNEYRKKFHEEYLKIKRNCH